MHLVETLQDLATTTLSTIASLFEMLGGLPFFVLLFAFFYLVYNKKFAYNYFLTYLFGFALGSLLLKNVLKKARPYETNLALFSERNSYSGSMPSAKCLLSAQSGAFIYMSSRQKVKNIVVRIAIIFILVLLSICVGFSQIYFANNYLIDCIIGALIGFVLSIVTMGIFSKIKIKKGFMLFLCLPLVVLLFVYVGEWFTSNFQNSAIFEFVGISLSILIGTFIEEKYIKFNETHNNIFNTPFKIFTMVIVLLAYNSVSQLLSGVVILSFFKYFIAGIIVTILLPLLFKKTEKYFYIFSNSVNKNNILESRISLSVKGTKKLGKKLFNKFNAGDVILLSGDLGAGKSELVRSILKCAGVKKEVTSPTFTLVNEYSTPKGHYYHFDMYRIESEEEVINIDFPELIDSTDAIKFIEWPEKVKNFLPKSYYKISIIKLGEKSRNIVLEDYTI